MTLNQSLAATILATGTLALAGCGVGEAGMPAPDAQADLAPLPVETAAPARADIFATYHTTATIDADAEAPVLARVGGEVVEILVEEGDRVEKGQVLARLDGDRLRLQMLQARATFEKSQNEQDRILRLKDRGLVSASITEGLEFDTDALEAAYELTRLDYEYTIIRAPINGVVSARNVKAGQHVDPNEALFTVTDTDNLVAYLRIPQTELGNFAAGHRASVSVDATPGTSFAAVVARISPTIDVRNGTFRATAYIDNRDGELAPGMFGRFDIAYEEHAGALVIPATAVVTEDSLTVVYVVRDGAAERRAIRTGIRYGDQVEVLDGLDDNEQIVVTGQGGLRDGSRVFASLDSGIAVTG